MGRAIPCIAQQAIKAGYAVKLVPDVTGNATGAFTSTNWQVGNIVIGANLPASDDETEAKYVAAFPVSNALPPLYETLPTLDTNSSYEPSYSLRGWLPGEANLPVAVTLRMTDPRAQDEQTIPSGTKMLAYDEGIYTLTSGCFLSASYVVGGAVGNKTTGKWYSSSTRIATVFEYDQAASKLTIKT